MDNEREHRGLLASPDNDGEFGPEGFEDPLVASLGGTAAGSHYGSLLGDEQDVGSLVGGGGGGDRGGYAESESERAHRKAARKAQKKAKRDARANAAAYEAAVSAAQHVEELDAENGAEGGAQEFVFCTECGLRTQSSAHVCADCGTLLTVQDASSSDDDSSRSRSSSGEEYGADVERGASRSHRSSSYDPFANVKTLHDLVSPPQAPTAFAQAEVYEVRFEPGKSGLSLDEDWLGKSLVVDDLPEADFLSPTESDRRNVIHCGDSVLAINGQSCAGLPLERVEAMLAEAQAAGAYKIRFRQAMRAEEAFGEDAGDAFEARSIIYRQKSLTYEPPDHMDMVYGYVMRFRGEKVISFHFYREADKKFLLAAVMQRNGKGRVIFHNDPRITSEAQINDVPVHSESARFLGSMVANFVGTSFTMHDYRVDNPQSTRKRIHHELGCVMYDSNVMGRVPNTLTAVLPRWDAEQGLKGQVYSISARFARTARTRLSKDLNLLQKLKAKKGDEYSAVELEEQEDLLTFETKKPSWNEDLQAWTLNFNGRVKLASKKNFLLVPNAKNEAMDEEFGSDTVCLRFGKVLKDRFSLDFRHPISPFQAFGIALSTFSNKLVVT